MLSDIITVVFIILLLIAFFLRKKIEGYFGQLGNDYGVRKRLQYEHEPILSDDEIVCILQKRKRHSPLYLAHVVRQAEARNSKSVEVILSKFHRQTRNRYKS